MKADEFLEEKGVEFEVVEQDNPTLDCDDAARERGVKTHQIVKSLIIEVEGEILHACIPGDRTLSERKVGSEYRLVDPEKSKEITGFDSGTVHPLSTDLEHLVDERVFEKERISFTTGERSRGVILKPSEFRKALEQGEMGFEISDFVVTAERDIEEIKSDDIGSEEASFLVDNGYRKTFLETSKKKQDEQVLRAVRKLHRQEIDFGVEEVGQLVERSENETHMLKLAEEYAENGDFPNQDEFSLEEEIEEVLEENPEAVEDLQNGKDSVINYLMGQVMESTNGKADAGEAKQMIMEAVR